MSASLLFFLIFNVFSVSYAATQDKAIDQALGLISSTTLASRDDLQLLLNDWSKLTQNLSGEDLALAFQRLKLFAKSDAQYATASVVLFAPSLPPELQKNLLKWMEERWPKGPEKSFTAPLVYRALFESSIAKKIYPLDIMGPFTLLNTRWMTSTRFKTLDEKDVENWFSDPPRVLYALGRQDVLLQFARSMDVAALAKKFPTFAGVLAEQLCTADRELGLPEDCEKELAKLKGSESTAEDKLKNRSELAWHRFLTSAERQYKDELVRIYEEAKLAKLETIRLWTALYISQAAHALGDSQDALRFATDYNVYVRRQHWALPWEKALGHLQVVSAYRSQKKYKQAQHYAEVALQELQTTCRGSSTITAFIDLDRLYISGLLLDTANAKKVAAKILVDIQGKQDIQFLSLYADAVLRTLKGEIVDMEKNKKSWGLPHSQSGLKVVLTEIHRLREKTNHTSKN